MGAATKSVLLTAKVSSDAKLILDVPPVFKDKTVAVQLQEISGAWDENDNLDPAENPRAWKSFLNEVYGSISDESFVAPARTPARPVSGFDE